MFTNNPLKTKYMKTGFIVLALGILGFVGTPIYWLFDTGSFDGIQISIMSIFGYIMTFGIFLVQINSAPRKISKTRIILGWMTAIIGLLFVIVFVSHLPMLCFLACFSTILIGCGVGGAFVPQPFSGE